MVTVTEINDFLGQLRDSEFDRIINYALAQELSEKMSLGVEKEQLSKVLEKFWGTSGSTEHIVEWLMVKSRSTPTTQ